ncbi:MAG TPA: hypothetical protein VNM87_12485 [Candidatus Udaeobacter sp.]|nr:hypothetical protein [Candidatus Udaeobacter sp.]
MPLLRYLVRAAAWSLLLAGLWLLAAPLTRAVLEGFTQLFLAIAHRPQPLTQRAHLGPVLFLALFLAAKPRGRRAIAPGVLGVLGCLAAQALTTAVLLLTGDGHEREPLMRLVRDAAIAADKIAPLVAALVLAPRTRSATRELPAVSAGRRARPRLRPRRSPPPGHPLPPDRSHM